MGDPKDDERSKGGSGTVPERADDLEPADRGYGSGGAGYGGAGTGAGAGAPGGGEAGDGPGGAGERPGGAESGAGAGRADERPAGQPGSVYDPGAGQDAGEVQGFGDAPQIEASPEDGESQDELVLSSTNTAPPGYLEQRSTGADDKPGAGL